MGVTGSIIVNLEGDGGRVHVKREEEEHGTLKGVRDDGGRIFAWPTHGERQWDSHATDPGGGNCKRGDRDIHGVLTTCVEASGMYGGWVPDKGTKSGKNEREFYVKALEGKDIDTTGGPGDSPTVQPLWNAYDGVLAVDT